ncbi:MAG: CocE/NonD family hydrolase [Solirubrobacteraceae bacterium]
MRDGVLLRADVYRPERAEQVPAVLGRTPYDRAFGPTLPAILDPERTVEAGIALVSMDVRGQHGSDGEFHPFRAERADGYDSVEWVAVQEWCNGAVAMAGRSYTAATQWLAAAAQPPHLRAIAPIAIGSNYFGGWVYQGGAFQLGFNLFWVQIMAGRGRRARVEEQYSHLPLADAPLARDSPGGGFYREWLEHPLLDDYWRALSIDGSYGEVRVPVLNVGGWYDIFLGGTLENFMRMRREGGSDLARRHTRLVVGPWAHGSTYGAYPDHSFAAFSSQDSIDMLAAQLEFLGGQLFEHEPTDATAREPTERAHGATREPAEPAAPVRIFVMGANRWREEPEWPLARAVQEQWYLHSDGDAATTGGGLSRAAPADEPPDTFTFDPRDPAPTIGGPTSLPGKFMRTNAGPLDQRPLEGRRDVLAYTSEPLPDDLEVTGPLSLRLHAATSARDADWVAKLCDVEPGGFSRILAEGVLRASFREGLQRQVPVQPGLPYEYTVDLQATSNVFLRGHHVRLLLTSSSFPRFDRNSGAALPPGDVREEDLHAAEQTIFHDAQRASWLLLPVVPA